MLTGGGGRTRADPRSGHGRRRPGRGLRSPPGAPRLRRRIRPLSDRPLALVHDYLTQRGGAERVVLTLADAHPSAPVFTSLFDPAGTFPGFADHDVRTLPLDHITALRANHRLALPLLAPSFSRLVVDAEVALCSSSGWAHGARVTGRKVVYCHNPARWLYQRDRYLRGRGRGSAAAVTALSPYLRRWDRRAARTAHRYVVNSREVRRRVADTYGIDAEVVPPPVAIDTEAETRAVDGLSPGFVLCVSRLLPYKNVDAACAAFVGLPNRQLVVVGTGPSADELTAGAPGNVTFLGEVEDAVLRWLYRASIGLLAPAFEDFGLTPIEAAAFGRPTAALRFGGYLDTVIEGETGLFFDQPSPASLAAAVESLFETSWDAGMLRTHARRFSVDRFVERMDAIIDEERARL